MLVLSLLTAVGSALIAGVFLVFSSFVMTALTNLQPAEGIRAMQRINTDVFCWSFSVLFFGIPLACLVLAGYATTHLSEPASAYYIGGSIVYVLGTFIVTALGNVPLNNSLARVDVSTDPAGTDAVEQWSSYVTRWARWNHVRVGASLVACLTFAGPAYLTL